VQQTFDAAFQNEKHLVIVTKPYLADDLYRALRTLGLTVKLRLL
jgi:hypothetical protein